MHSFLLQFYNALTLIGRFNLLKKIKVIACKIEDKDFIFVAYCVKFSKSIKLLENNHLLQYMHRNDDAYIRTKSDLLQGIGTN